MSDFLHKTGSVPIIAGVSDRGHAARPPASARAPDSKAEGEPNAAPSLTHRSSGAADYARIKAGIADVVARIESSPSKAIEPVTGAERALMALMPQPVIMLPLPPADPAMIAFVAQVAQSMAAQAAQARAAQATSTPIMVEAAGS